MYQEPISAHHATIPESMTEEQIWMEINRLLDECIDLLNKQTERLERSMNND